MINVAATQNTVRLINIRNYGGFSGLLPEFFGDHGCLRPSGRRLIRYCEEDSNRQNRQNRQNLLALSGTNVQRAAPNPIVGIRPCRSTPRSKRPDRFRGRVGPSCVETHSAHPGRTAARWDCDSTAHRASRPPYVPNYSAEHTLTTFHTVREHMAGRLLGQGVRSAADLLRRLEFVKGNQFARRRVRHRLVGAGRPPAGRPAARRAGRQGRSCRDAGRTAPGGRPTSAARSP